MYWLVSLPWLDTEDRTWQLLQNKVSYENNYAENFKFKLPELRVGTLDSLMVLSDDLVKTNQLVEAVVNKLRRQLFDLQSSGGTESEVTVEGTAPDDYVKGFQWDQAKYPPRRPLQETVKTITETVQKLEDDLKVCIDRHTSSIACCQVLSPHNCPKHDTWPGKRTWHCTVQKHEVPLSAARAVVSALSHLSLLHDLLDRSASQKLQHHAIKLSVADLTVWYTS